jgi:thioredoxin-related protein
MRHIFLMLALLCYATAFTQVYFPNANAEKDIATAIKQAQLQNKHVLVVGGGNWCKWCIEFDKFRRTDKEIDSTIKANYILVKLNYSRENYNAKLYKKYGNPQRFGFPVFLILDKNGNRIHTQNSTYFEDGRNNVYNKALLWQFLQQWSYKAVNFDWN